MKKFSCILICMLSLMTIFAGVGSASYLSMENDGFTDIFADVNFDNYAATDVMDTTNTKVEDSSVKGDVALVNITGTPTSEEGRGMVMKVTGKSYTSRLYNAKAAWTELIDDYYTYKKTNPPVVKAEIDVKTSHSDFSSGRIYIVANDVDGRECILASFYASKKGVRQLCFGRSDQGNTVPEGNSEKVDKLWSDNTWLKFTFYLDFANNCYDAYLGEEYVGNFVLDNSKGFDLNGLMYFGVGFSTDGGNAYIDNLKVTVLPLGELDKVVRYKTKLSNENAAYFIRNFESADATVQMITAKYTKDGKLEDVQIDEFTAPAYGGSFFTKNLTTDAESDLKNYSYKVFALDSKSTLIPLAANLEVNQ